MNKNGTFTEREAQVIDFLKGFVHRNKTNVAKNALSNHDAAMIIFASLGPMRLSEATDILKAWRPDNDDGRELHYTYLFSQSTYGGYGFCAKEPMQKGNWMAHDKWHCRTIGQKQPKNPMTKVGFRRTYWWRSGRGMYAPTIEGMKRMRELFPNGINS